MLFVRPSRLADLDALEHMALTAQPVRIQTRGQVILLYFERDWLAAHPLSEYALSIESGVWRKVGFVLEIAVRDPAPA